MDWLEWLGLIAVVVVFVAAPLWIGAAMRRVNDDEDDGRWQ